MVRTAFWLAGVALASLVSGCGSSGGKPATGTGGVAGSAASSTGGGAGGSTAATGGSAGAAAGTGGAAGAAGSGAAGAAGGAAGGGGTAACVTPDGGAGAAGLTLDGTATRPLLNASDAARYTTLEYLAQAGPVGSLVTDHWDSDGGRGGRVEVLAELHGGGRRQRHARHGASRGHGRRHRGRHGPRLHRGEARDVPRGGMRSEGRAAHHAVRHQQRRDGGDHRLRQLRRQSTRRQRQPVQRGQLDVVRHQRQRHLRRLLRRLSSQEPDLFERLRRGGLRVEPGRRADDPGRPADLRERPRARQSGHALREDVEHPDGGARLLQVLLRRGGRGLHLRPRNRRVRRLHAELPDRAPGDEGRQRTWRPAPRPATPTASW